MANKPPFILFKVTAKNNLANAIDCVENIHRHIADKYSYKILVSCNYDDEQLYNRNFTGQIQDLSKQGIRVVPVFGESNSIVQHYNRDLNVFDCWKILVNLCDNMRFTLQGFDDLIRAYYFNNNLNFDSILRFNHDYLPNSFPLAILGRSYYMRHGYLYHESYKNHYFDREHLEVATILNRKMLSKYTIHSLVNRARFVEMNKAAYNTDKRNYISRKKNNFFLKKELITL